MCPAVGHTFGQACSAPRPDAVATHVSSSQDDESIGNRRGQIMDECAGAAKGMVHSRNRGALPASRQWHTGWEFEHGTLRNI